MWDIKFKKEFPKLDSLSLKVLEPAMKNGMFLAERTSKKDYLSGPRPKKLGVVTGRLWDSVKAKTILKRNELIGQLGTNVFYGRFWEDVDTYPKHNKPFLRPAIEDNLTDIENLLWGALENAWGK